MHKHTFLWHYKKETLDDSDQKRVEACNGTVQNCVTPDDTKVEDIKSKTVKTENKGKSILCIVLYHIIFIIKVKSMCIVLIVHITFHVYLVLHLIVTLSE